MPPDLIRYDLLVQDAMRDVVRRVLAGVADAGELPGEHHFKITFRTDAPGVKISRRLAQQWPQELTIILQHQFSGLMVDEQGFSVTLSFRSVPEGLYVPFDAITVFADPSVSFGVKFNVEVGEEEGAGEPRPTPKPAPVSVSGPFPSFSAAKADAVETLLAGVKASASETSAPKAKAEPKSEPKAKPHSADQDAEGGKIVSIDAFRKKP